MAGYSFRSYANAVKADLHASTYMVESGANSPNPTGREVLLCQSPTDGIPAATEDEGTGEITSGKAKCKVFYIGDTGKQKDSALEVEVLNTSKDKDIEGDKYFFAAYINADLIALGLDATGGGHLCKTPEVGITAYDGQTVESGSCPIWELNDETGDLSATAEFLQVFNPWKTDIGGSRFITAKQTNDGAWVVDAEDCDPPPEEIVLYQGDYAPVAVRAGSAPYNPYDMVRSSGWLAIANVTTSVDPAPTISGDATYDLSDVPAWTLPTQSGEVVYGNVYVFTEAGMVFSLEVWLESSQSNYSVESYAIASDGVTLIPLGASGIDSSSVSTGRWVVVNSGSDIWQPGAKVGFFVRQTPTTGSAQSYPQLTDFWLTGDPTWATGEGYLSLDGVQQTVPNDAFGVRLKFQALATSPDWDILGRI